jgi:hypothetical protein
MHHQSVILMEKSKQSRYDSVDSKKYKSYLHIRESKDIAREKGGIRTWLLNYELIYIIRGKKVYAKSEHKESRLNWQQKTGKDSNKH